MTAAFPEVRLVIDGKEQRTQRPKRYAAQKPYYSGKKKTHTLKSQVAVTPTGRVASFSGSMHDRIVRRMTKLVDRLPVGVGAMKDMGYVAIRAGRPARRSSPGCASPRG